MNNGYIITALMMFEFSIGLIVGQYLPHTGFKGVLSALPAFPLIFLAVYTFKKNK